MSGEWFGVPTGSRLDTGDPDRPAFTMEPLKTATEELVALARERKLEEIDAERFGEQLGREVIDAETGIAYEVVRAHVEYADPMGVTHFAVRDGRLVPLRVKGADDGRTVSEYIGTMTAFAGRAR